MTDRGSTASLGNVFTRVLSSADQSPAPKKLHLRTTSSNSANITFNSGIVGQWFFGNKWAKRLFRWKLRYWPHWAVFAFVFHFCSFSPDHPNLGKFIALLAKLPICILNLSVLQISILQQIIWFFEPWWMMANYFIYNFLWMMTYNHWGYRVCLFFETILLMPGMGFVDALPLKVRVGYGRTVWTMFSVLFLLLWINLIFFPKLSGVEEDYEWKIGPVTLTLSSLLAEYAWTLFFFSLKYTYSIWKRPEYYIIWKFTIYSYSKNAVNEGIIDLAPTFQPQASTPLTPAQHFEDNVEIELSTQNLLVSQQLADPRKRSPSRMIELHTPAATTPTFSKISDHSPSSNLETEELTLPRSTDRIIAMEWIDVNGLENRSIAKPKITDDILAIRYFGEFCFSEITIRRMRWVLVNYLKHIMCWTLACIIIAFGVINVFRDSFIGTIKVDAFGIFLYFVALSPMGILSWSTLNTHIMLKFLTKLEVWFMTMNYILFGIFSMIYYYREHPHEEASQVFYTIFTILNAIWVLPLYNGFVDSIVEKIRNDYCMIIYTASAVFWSIRGLILFLGSSDNDYTFKTGSVNFTLRGIIISTCCNLAIFSAKYCVQIYFWPNSFVMYRSKIEAVALNEDGKTSDHSDFTTSRMEIQDTDSIGVGGETMNDMNVTPLVLVSSTSTDASHSPIPNEDTSAYDHETHPVTMTIEPEIGSDLDDNQGLRHDSPL